MIIERQYSPSYFQHCVTIANNCSNSKNTIANTQQGTFIAYYTGKAECHVSQHVEIQFIHKNGKEAKPLKLGNFTGNPILFNTDEGVRIIYSKFEDPTGFRAKWWQSCSLWTAWVSCGIDHENEVIMGKPKQIKINQDGLGYLVRCHPIKLNGEYLVPIYREQEPYFHGAIMSSTDGLNWKHKGDIGKGEYKCIQPTIWYDPQHDKLRSLLRNFNRMTDKPFAYYSESSDQGKTWTPLTHSPYYNANNSIVVINPNNIPLVIWNHDPRGRNNICLGTFSLDKPKIIAKLDGYGGYPSVDINGDTLSIAYTAIPNSLVTSKSKTVIKVKNFNLKEVLKIASK